jgi:hypothetical protein
MRKKALITLMAWFPYATSLLIICNRSNSYRFTSWKSVHHCRTLSNQQLQLSTADASLLLSIKAWYDDDLPNILGINPIEAAIIFGALYYFYGPTVLYEYAREAGGNNGLSLVHLTARQNRKPLLT